MVALWEAEHAMRDRDVVSAVFVERYGSLVGLARLLLDRREDAEEVVQEAFARTLEGWGRLRTPDDPYAYVRRAVVNLARSGLRRRIVARRYAPDAPDAPEGPDLVVVAGEERRAVADAVAALPRRQRECVVLRYFEGCSTAETASALEISEGSVKTHLHRALVTLETRLEEMR